MSRRRRVLGRTSARLDSLCRKARSLLLLLLLLCRPPLLISDSDRITVTFDRITTVAILGSFDRDYPKQVSRSFSFGMPTKSEDRQRTSPMRVQTSQRLVIHPTYAIRIRLEKSEIRIPLTQRLFFSSNTSEDHIETDSFSSTRLLLRTMTCFHSSASAWMDRIRLRDPFALTIRFF